MRHTKAVTRRPAQAQSAYASKLQFKQEASTLITDGLVGLGDAFMTIGSALYVNGLGLSFINIVVGGTGTTT